MTFQKPEGACAFSSGTKWARPAHETSAIFLLFGLDKLIKHTHGNTARWISQRMLHNNKTIHICQQAEVHSTEESAWCD